MYYIRQERIVYMIHSGKSILLPQTHLHRRRRSENVLCFAPPTPFTETDSAREVGTWSSYYTSLLRALHFLRRHWGGGEGCLQIKMARTTRQGDPNLIPSDHDKLPILETSHPGRKGTLGLAHGNGGHPTGRRFIQDGMIGASLATFFAPHDENVEWSYLIELLRRRKTVRLLDGRAESRGHGDTCLGGLLSHLCQTPLAWGTRGIYLDKMGWDSDTERVHGPTPCRLFFPLRYTKAWVVPPGHFTSMGRVVRLVPEWDAVYGGRVTK